MARKQKNTKKQLVSSATSFAASTVPDLDVNSNILNVYAENGSTQIKYIKNSNGEIIWSKPSSCYLNDNYITNGINPAPAFHANYLNGFKLRDVKLLQTPIRGMYTFKGWYTESGVLYTDDTELDMKEDSFTLYAKWEDTTPEPYVVRKKIFCTPIGDMVTNFDTAISKITANSDFTYDDFVVAVAALYPNYYRRVKQIEYQLYLKTLKTNSSSKPLHVYIEQPDSYPTVLDYTPSVTPTLDGVSYPSLTQYYSPINAGISINRLVAGFQYSAYDSNNNKWFDQENSYIEYKITFKKADET